MITISNLSIQFSGITLFDNVNFVIEDKDRIGLVGKNGAGKSTLLKIISNFKEPETGSVVRSKDQSIGYLPQELIPSSTKNVIDEMMTVFAHIKEMENKQQHLAGEISKRTDYESKEYEQLLTKHYEITERLNFVNIAEGRAEAEKILIGLGFLHSDFERGLNEFSSGWQMRVELAKILLQKPDIILLDEPTNHLDIVSITWLEKFLASYSGTIVLVSHDRTFLDRVTKRTVEITAGKIYDYKVSYSGYVSLMLQRRASQASILSNQQKQIAEIEKFIERFRYKSTKAKQVQSKIKQIEKMELEKIDEVDFSTIHFSFPPAPHSGKIVIEVKDLSKSYRNKEKEVLKNINLLITKGEKVAFIGRNGEGKSTLAKIIVGDLKYYSGIMRLGYNVTVGYFAQNQATLLNPELSVFETIDQIAVGTIRTKIRNILGSFLFDENDIDKKVKVLSGGEKSRLALAKLLLTPVNLLVLDEPTNHLDMDSKNILKQALLRYDGTLIIVSHDRDFLNGLTDTLYEFKNKQIHCFKGDIFDFLSMRDIEDLEALNIKAKNKKLKTEKVITESKAVYEENKEQNRLLRKIKSQIEQIENKISDLETRIAEKENIFHDEQKAIAIANDKDFFKEYNDMKKLLSQYMEQWEALCNELALSSSII
ncbi:MAG: ABC-F family ATP-binding cassette domain-containing protein [Bacteroidales bacterium]|jgi:ATP-binding cassette subfamily F protein 3|nr:ABC-F family ATP-binding cassette domain-containing protein [Bacteroidales bacterium]